MRKLILSSLLFFLAIIISGCGLVEIVSPTKAVPVEEGEKELSQYVELSFSTHVPASTRDDEQIHLQILDEVTGLLINPVTYSLERTDVNLYTARIPVPLGSVVKYRYTFGDNQTNIEFTPSGQPVRYRMVSASKSMTIEDTVSTWTGEFTGNYGRILGVVQDENGEPVSNALIVVAGNQALTTSEGTFLLDGLPIGKHLIVVYSLDGEHEVFQQEVTVATDSATPVEVSVKKSQFVNVTFHLTVPEDSFTKLPIRLIGNQYQTGNVFTDLVGGISVPASRAPYLSFTGGRQHEIVLRLPVGADFRYKYSHGDGFWSAEQSSTERFPVRQLIVPKSDIDVYDTVESWSISEKSPISFVVEVPENMPDGGSVSIQFRPFDWMTPIPMWQVDDTHWFLPLTSPLNYFDDLNYRYCLNNDCDQAPEVNLDGLMIQRTVQLDTVPVNIEDSIWGWRWFDKQSDTSDVFSVSPQPKDETFLIGFESEEIADFENQPFVFQGIQSARALNAEVMIFSPDWITTRINIPNLEPVIGTTVLDLDLEQQIFWAEQSGMLTGLYPSVQLGRFEEYFWEYAQQDFGWWDSMFDRYQTFLMHFAALAEKNSVDYLVIGEPFILEAYDRFQDTTQPGIQRNEFVDYLGQGLEQVNQTYSGKLFWAVKFDGTEKSLTIPEGIEEQVDGYYVLWAIQQSADGALTSENYAPLFMENLETLKSISETGKVVIIAFDYPAIPGAEKGMILQGENQVSVDAIDDYSAFQLDEQTQQSLYSIAFNAIESQDWVDGFISRGYSLTNSVPDPSPSVRGKAAERLIQLWFDRWTANKN